MKKTTLLTFAIFTLLILSSIVSSQSEDFNVYSDRAIIEVSQCNTIINTLYIQNAGDINSIYVLSQSNSFSTLTANYISLNKGEQTAVYDYINVPCDAEDGTYELDTLITTGLGNEKMLKQAVSVKRTNNIYLAITDNSVSMKPCEIALFKGIIANTGNFTEKYTLDVQNKDIGQFVMLSDSEIELEPMQKKEFIITINPSCGVSGDYNLKLVTQATKNMLQSSIDLNLNIEKAYNYNVMFGDFLSNVFVEHSDGFYLCEYQPKKIPFIVTNKAEIVNDYDIKLINNPEWITLEYNQIKSLAPEKNVTLFINLNPKEGTNEKYNVTFDIKSGFGEVEKTAILPITLYNCYTPLLEQKGIKVNYTQTKTNIKLKNTGVKEATYSISSDLPSFVKLPTSIYVNATKETMLSITTSPIVNVTQEGTYNGIISFTSENKVEYQLPFNVELTEGAKIYSEKNTLLISLIAIFTATFVVLLISLYLAKARKKIAEIRPYKSVAKSQIKITKIVEKKIKPQKKKRIHSKLLRWILYGIGALLILVAIGAFFYIFSNGDFTLFKEGNVTKVINQTKPIIVPPAKIDITNITKTNATEFNISSAISSVKASLINTKPFFIKCWTGIKSAAIHTKEFFVKIAEGSVGKFILAYWPYILAGIVILALIIFFIVKRKDIAYKIEEMRFELRQRREKRIAIQKRKRALQERLDFEAERKRLERVLAEQKVVLAKPSRKRRFALPGFLKKSSITLILAALFAALVYLFLKFRCWGCIKIFLKSIWVKIVWFSVILWMKILAFAKFLFPKIKASKVYIIITIIVLAVLAILIFWFAKYGKKTFRRIFRFIQSKKEDWQIEKVRRETEAALATERLAKASKRNQAFQERREFEEERKRLEKVIAEQKIADARKKRIKKQLKPYLIAVIAILAVVLVVFYGTKLLSSIPSVNVTSTTNLTRLNLTGIPDQTVVQGTMNTIDLNKHFKDPDSGDKLNFTSTQASGISVSIVNGIASIQANENFYGTAIIMFIASDTKGGFAKSNVVKVSVVAPSKLKTIYYKVKYYVAKPFLWAFEKIKSAAIAVKNFFIAYIEYFISGIVILFILLILIRFYKPISEIFEEHKKKKR